MTSFTMTSFEQSYIQAEDKSSFWKEQRSNDPMCIKFIDEVLETPCPIRNVNNPIFKTDSYKGSQGSMNNDVKKDKNNNKQRFVRNYSYLEARKGSRDPYTIVAGTNNVINKLIGFRVTMDDIKEAICFYARHFSTPNHFAKYHFNPFPWLKVVLEYNGHLPMRLSAIPEGTIVPIEIPICVVESTDEDCAQLVTYFEGIIQQAYWYPTTVATNALGFSTVIKNALLITTTLEILISWLMFSLQDFGFRGCTSEESAMIGGMAALYVTWGSDTVPAIIAAMHTLGFVDDNGEVAMPGYSVAACEHNNILSRGRDGEFESIKNMIELFPEGILSVVVDTYDLRNNIETITTGEIHEMIMARNGTFVARPDSQLLDADGNELSPAETISEIFAIMGKNLAKYITVNEKGFKLLPKQYKIIYGDGLNIPKIKSILDRMISDGWCATNIIFGVGGNLLQNINRDTFRFAMKSSLQEYEVTNVDGSVTREIREVCKKTPGKESKSGRFHVAEIDGVVQCNDINDPKVIGIHNMLERYYENGNICKFVGNLNDIRKRVNDGRAKYNL